MKKISILFLLIVWLAFGMTITAQNTVLSPVFPAGDSTDSRSKQIDWYD